MESELKKQLNHLKVNQRNDLKLPSKNADFSLLFDFRNSKKIEIDTFYELGYMGLIELAKTEEKLLEYIANVFSPFAKYYNRNMKTEEEIKEIDQNIESLVKILNPYFLNQSCHKIIEYLIKIYQVNIFNSRILLLTFLPFHESKIFVKLLQNINLENIKHFSFMSQSAKNGTIVLKEQIISELSKNYEMFKEILEFYTTNLTNGFKFSSYSTFIFDLITKVVLSKEKTNENIITLIIKFLNSLFLYIKKKSSHDPSLPLIISGVCEILLCLLTKFDISGEYYCAIVNEYILNIVPKLYKSSSNLTRFTGSLIIIFSIKVNTF
jgi:U3 small nucleolar RNA-associated protein 10